MDVKTASTEPKKQQKRRACDECRGRKLACSKEPEGCARCVHEGIRCNYSAQKPMGRPRKRPHAEIEGALPEDDCDGDRVAIVPPFDSTIGLDLDLSFLDVANQDFNFLDLLDTDFQSAAPFGLAAAQDVPAVAPNPSPFVLSYSGDIRVAGGLFHMGGDINFDPPPVTPPTPQAEEITLEEIAQIMSSSNVPSLSRHSSSRSSSMDATPEDSASPATPSPLPCDCSARLYCALESLQRLPNEICSALNITRNGARTAHNTVMCTVCGLPPLELSHRPPIASFQNMMMLGALLPSLSNAYVRILAMVDEETAKADAARSKIPFSLEGYGGMWGAVAHSKNACSAASNLEGVMLEPSMWRLTVRALLRFDVYGINEADAGGGASVTCDLTQPGLKDIISMMEARSRKRHEELDALVASGAIEDTNLLQYISHSSADDLPCMRIIDIAKKSIADLVIP
ncbi:hypothetical protein B0T22DRAFT_371180 [Podospora appendiculata]|uniref:Zn(2)-C6 fungal-type domain-containing protein n=1 Tax=Podospora appendiculata TaxID=314037 RepID=A0AAE1CHV7_9PEZI|nr:hypothetical protein B0T22DRAFT_371180 [Podospora appendiculata]